MTLIININTDSINNLDLSSALSAIEKLPKNQEIAEYEQKLKFAINYQKEETDPRELSEIPEIRLWFLRLDAVYPWLPFLLDWKNGELALYTAMLVPHQFSRSEGIIFNPEALEIFVMQKIFVIGDWLKQKDITIKSRLQSMAKMLGYDIDDSFFDLIY
ncbi:MAG: CRR6 family NdhI maturation factor [Xenococcaceae cyanobacterium MO_188.B29]|nr:CRR6 family NdhI maturation factor [Xenococcaceae cyanobacterium MO_188.B29]